MPNKIATKQQLVAENIKLSEQLEKAEASLRDILSGETDALFVSGAAGANIFAVKGADQAYRTLIEQMSEGALTLTPNGLVLYANQRFAEMLGMPLENVIGSDIFSWFASESRQVVQNQLLKDNPDKHSEELVLAAIDGTQVLVYVSVNRIVMDGEPDVYGMVVTDLTEQKRNKAILTEEKLVRAILEQAADVIVICDESGRIIRANKQAQMFNDKNIIGQQFAQAFPLRRPDGTAIYPAGSINVNSCQSLEARLEHNAKEFYFLISIGHLKGAQNELLGSAVTLTDITEHKQTEAARDRLAVIIESTTDLVITGDPAGHLMYLNPAAYTTLGLGMEEDITQLKIADFIPDPDDNPGLTKGIPIAIREGSWSGETVLTNRSGLEIPVTQVILTHRDSNGKIDFFSTIMRDITGLKLAEQKLHDSQQLLNSIVLSAMDSILTVDSEQHIVLTNPAAEKMFGYTSKELEQLSLNMLLPERFHAEHLVHVEKFDKAGVTNRRMGALGMVTGLRKNGEEFPIEVSISKNESAGRQFYSAILRDVTERKQAELKLLESERRFTDLLGNVELVSIMLDLKARITYCNDYLLRLTGWKREEVIGKNWWDIFMPPELTELKDAVFTKLLDNQPEARHHENEILTRSGKHRLIHWNNTLLYSEEGEVIGTASIGEDITERKKSESRIIHLNRVYAMLSGINILIVRVNDRDELFRGACQIAVEEGGFLMSLIGIVDQSTMRIVPIASTGKDEELLSTIKSLLSSGKLASNTMVAQAIREKQAIVSNDSQNDPRVVFAKKYAESGVRSMAVLPLIVADEATGVLALYSDETNLFNEEEMKLLTELTGDIAFAMKHIEKQNQLEYITHYDVLTGLANRSQFLSRLSHSLRGRRGEQRMIAIVLLDIERFRNVNESLGRIFGDKLLRDVGSRLQRANDSVARIGNDMYSLILRGFSKPIEIKRRLEVILADCFGEPFTQGVEELRVACRAGLALYPSDGTDADTLLRNAETALRGSKHSGERIVFYAAEMNETVAGNLALENKLRQAIGNEEFVLHYQPKVDLLSDEITGVEALIRWDDPRTGLVPPDMFIPILEETGLIYEVGRWALHNAMTDYLRWCAAGMPAVRIAVNVSPLQLRNKEFINEIRQLISIDRNAAAGLELEITESIIMENVTRAISSLQAIRDLGITIAIDDFGTGFSSLNYLSKLPVDTLKIDRSFVNDMTTGPQGLSLVSAIITLAHSLKLKVVAEGVETEQQLQLLRSFSCDEMQGYLFSKPVPADILETRFLVPPPGGKK